MPISENIKILRERYGITQKELAEIAHVTDKAVSTWELGTNEPRMGAIQRIADHFGIQKSNIIEDGAMDAIFEKPATASSDRLVQALNARPLLRELFEVLVQLDDEHLRALAITVGAPIPGVPHKEDS